MSFQTTSGGRNHDLQVIFTWKSLLHAPASYCCVFSRCYLRFFHLQGTCRNSSEIGLMYLQVTCKYNALAGDLQEQNIIDLCPCKSPASTCTCRWLARTPRPTNNFQNQQPKIATRNKMPQLGFEPGSRCPSSRCVTNEPSCQCDSSCFNCVYIVRIYM